MILIEDPDHDSETCCFCQQAKPGERTNVFTAVVDEDERAHLSPIKRVRFHNNAKSLGRNIVSEQKLPPEGFWVVQTSDTTYQTSSETARDVLEVGVAAHHLIPGNAALAKSRLIEPKYLGSGGTAVGNIGYDINKAENGVWVPGNYAIHSWGEGACDFAGDAFGYASAAITTVRAQFHDAHPVYSDHVREALEKLADKVDHCEEICPYAADQDPATRTLVTLVARLDFLSSRCRRMVTLPSGGWKRDMHLSRYSLDYMKFHQIGV